MRINPVGVGLHLALFGLCSVLFGIGVGLVVVSVVFLVVHSR